MLEHNQRFKATRQSKLTGQLLSPFTDKAGKPRLLTVDSVYDRLVTCKEKRRNWCGKLGPIQVFLPLWVIEIVE